MEQIEDNPHRHLEDLQQIRTIMERSSRFISLSGFSGVFVGIFALIGEYIAVQHFHVDPFNFDLNSYGVLHGLPFFGNEYATPLVPGWHFSLKYDFTYFMVDAVIVLLLSLFAATTMSWRRARINGDKVWNAASKRLLANLFIPLAAGGIFCIAMLYQHYVDLIIPATLIFYGIALFNAGKYTLNDIRFLGIIEICLGLLCCFFTPISLVLWGLGFGVMHIVYGIVMYYKYER